MEPTSTAVRVYSDQPQKRPWPQADRPTVNTVLSNNLASSSITAPSPHLSSSAVSTPSSSYPSSPWSQSLGTSQPLPFAYFADGAHASSHPSQSPHPNNQLNSPADWNALLSNPMDPAMFAALEANGAIAPVLAKQPFSQQLNSSQYISHPMSSNNVSNINAHPHAGVGVSLRDSWTNSSTPPYSPNYNPNSQHASPSQSPQSSSGLSHAKGKASAATRGGGHPYGSMHTHPSEGSVGNGATRHGERHGSEPKGFVNLQNVINRPNLLSRRSGQFSVAGEVNGEMRLGMPPPPFPPHLGANRPSNRINISSERAHFNLPPSLWMSPLNPNPVMSSANPTSSAYPALTQLSMPNVASVPSMDTAPSSASSSRPSTSPFVSGSASTITSVTTELKSPSTYTDILADDLFAKKLPVADADPSCYPSPNPSASKGSPDLSSIALDNALADPTKMAEQDPLAAQIWRMYARTKASLPHAQRMENLTWRMMTLALKKAGKEELKAGSQKERDFPSMADFPSRHSGALQRPPFSKEINGPTSGGADIKTEQETRGRRPDKTAARVRVVGFEGKNQDDEEEYVF